MYEKCGQHKPLIRQIERHAREGVELGISMLADQAGGITFAVCPPYEPIAAHVLAQRLHGDDTLVPVLAKSKTYTARPQVYVRRTWFVG